MITKVTNLFHKYALRLSSNTIILSLREGYIALIPFFIVASLVTLVNQWLNISEKASEHQFLSDFNNLVWGLFPLLTIVSFSYYLSKNFRINTIATPILVITCFTVTTGYVYVEDNQLLLNHRAGVFQSLLMPVWCVYLLAFVEKLKYFKIIGDSTISLFLRKHLNLIFPYLIVTALTLGLFPYLNTLGSEISDFVKAQQLSFSVSEKISLQILLSHLFWFFGVHGDNTYHIMVSNEMTYYFVLPELTSYNFFSNFIILGGTGCIWGLILASFLLKNGEHEKKVAKISSPLALFNISEVMIYALPIVFNPFILIPFILTPFFNAIVSLYFLESGLLTITSNESIPWFTPIFLNIWMLTESIYGVLLQVALIAINTAMYYPFLKYNQENQLSGKALDVLLKKYSAGKLIEERAESSFATSHAQQQLSAQSLKMVTDALNQGSLTLYYQPKVNPLNGTVIGFEALLRLKNADGTVVGPWFLETLLEHDLLHVVDDFVIDQLEVDLERFSKHGFRPKVSFNIAPANLLSGAYKRIVKAFSNFPNQIEVELLESSYIDDFDKTVHIVNMLKQHEITCALDDFGTGYSSLSVLSKLNIETIKLDRSLLPDDDDKANILYQQLASLVSELGFKIVAEGVENKNDEALVLSSNIHCAQGFKYHKALPFDSCLSLLEEQNKKYA